MVWSGTLRDAQDTIAALETEVKRLRVWQDEVVRGYEFKDADEMLAWVRHIWEEEEEVE